MRKAELLYSIYIHMLYHVILRSRRESCMYSLKKNFEKRLTQNSCVTKLEVQNILEKSDIN